MTASVGTTEQLLFSILLQLVIMIGAARAMNGVFRRLGQPGVIGEIVAGLLLGPSLFGHLFPSLSLAVFGAKSAAPITVISQIGLILLMFQIGMDFEFGHLSVKRNMRAVGLIALASVTIPFVSGLAIGVVSGATLAPGIDRSSYSLFIGVALAITAVPILGRILREFGLSRTEIGVVAVSAAAINDVVGWVMLATVSAYATARLSASGVSLQIGGIVAMVAVLWFVLQPLVTKMLRWLPVRDGRLPPSLMAIVLCLIFALSLCTFTLGIFAIFGGFAAGLLFHRHAAFVAAWHNQVGQFVLVFFLPIFFTFTGLRTNLLALDSASDLPWLMLILAVAIASKIVPVYIAARMSGFDRNESLILGSLMNTRALMELIVLNIGYDAGYIPQKMFTTLVIMAVATTLMTGPLLKLLLPRAGYRVAAGVEA